MIVPQWLIACFLVSFSAGVTAETERFMAADSEGIEAFRIGNALLLNLEAGVKAPITIPRLMAPLRSIEWMGDESGPTIKLSPEPDSWKLSWKGEKAGRATIVLTFDSPPLLPEEVKPIKAAGDGSFFLPAHLAVTRGEKIRYEPQPNKNTVGYWVGKKDSAAWTIKLDQPGRFSVAILQGCGRGQGGSQASISFISPVKDVYPSIDFEVVETGHFQNFQWHHLGEVQIRHTEVEVIVAPKNISKGALMDIRAVHLVRLPDAKP